jgi:hypothetical protein
MITKADHSGTTTSVRSVTVEVTVAVPGPVAV